MRLRIIVIVDPLSSQGIVDLLLFSPYSIDAPGEIFLTLSYPDYHPEITMASQCIILPTQNYHNPTSTFKKAMDLYQDFNLFLVAALYQKYLSLHTINS
jgi:hypothetical protein